jgi:hypothetical protein
MSSYIEGVSAIIAKAQITNGGPVILLQVENEYAGGDDVYFSIVRDQYRNNSIVVPLINNDINHGGRQRNLVNIYGHDGYPLGFDCADPTVWPTGQLTAVMGNWRADHLMFAPDTAYEIVEVSGI